MKDRISHSNCKFISLTGVEVRMDVIMTREDTKAGLGQIMHIEDIQDIVENT